MRVLFASANFGNRIVGGAQVSIKLVADRLNELGHTVGVAFVDPGGQRVEIDTNGTVLYRLSPNNVHWHLSPRKSAPRRFVWHLIDRFGRSMRKDFRGVIDDFRPDIVHTNVLGGLTTSVWAESSAHRIPVVHTIHDYYLVCRNSGMRSNGLNCGSQCSSCRFFSTKNRQDTAHVSAVAYVSQHMRKVHEAAGLFVGDKFVTEEIIGSFERKYPPVRPMRDGALRIGFLGRIAPDKGLDRLIQEIGRLPRDTVRLIVGGVGEVSYVDSLKMMAGDTNVSFLGRVSPDEFYDSIDVIVVASLWNEPAARVVYEAGLSDLPVIVSARGGLPELVGYGQRGWIYDPDIPGSLESVIREIDVNWQLALSKAREWHRVSHEFSAYHITERTLSLYQRAIDLRENT